MKVTINISDKNAERLFQATCDKKECTGCAYQDYNSCFEAYEQLGGLATDVEGLFEGMMSLIYDTKL